jgi:hypothetical protein
MGRRFLTYLGLYGALILAAIPLALGWIPPNRWYGFRFPGALFSPQLWYEINALGGKMFIAGLLLCASITALAVWRAPKTMQPYLPWLNAALILLNFWLVTTELLSRLPT